MTKTAIRNFFDNPLLIPRRETAKLLGGISIATILRMEKRRQLTPLQTTPNGAVMHRYAEVLDLVDRMAPQPTPSKKKLKRAS